ncbi:MAG TPA: PAS domain S-box protein, partial [Chitinophagaceae bacterium]|nr:PAS domain S-box protein [Chitinophagaceae bacterium]
LFTILFMGAAIYYYMTQGTRLKNEYDKQTGYVARINASDELGLHIKTAESAIRGYLLTGDPVFAHEFKPSINSVRSAFLRLQQLQKREENKSGTPEFAISNSLLNRKIAFMEQVYNYCEENNRPAAQILMEGGEGRMLSDSITKINLQINEMLLAKLDRSRTEFQLSGRRYNTLAFASVIISLLLFLLVLYFLVKEIDKTRKISEEFRVEKENFRLTLNSLGEGLISTDTDGRIVYMNPAAEKFTGWNWRDAKKQELNNVFKVENEATGKPIENVVTRILRDRKKIEWENNTVLKSKANEDFIIRNSSSPILDDSGNLSGAVLVFNDITKQTKLNKELKEKEKQYMDLIQGLPEAVYTCDASGHIQLYNKAAVELWGREPDREDDNCCGALKLFNPDGTDLPFDSCPMAITIKEVRPVHGREVLMLQPDGSIRHVLPYPSPLFNSEGRLSGAVNMLLDITTKKEREILVKKSEEKYKDLIEQASDVIIVFSYDGTIHQFNNSACNLSGYSGEEFSRLKISDILVGDLIMYKNLYSEIMLGKTVLVNRQYKQKNGQVRDMEFSVRLMADGNAITFGRDITERRKAEEKLQQSYNRFEIITRAANDALWEWELESGNLWANEIHQQLYGLTVADPVPTEKQWRERIHPDDRQRMMDRQAEALSSDNNVFISEYRFRVEGAGYRNIYDRCFIDRDSEGNAVRMMGSMLDITERKKKEEAIIEANKQLRLLSGHMEKIREEERAHMAREIHDELGQQLTIMKMDITWLINNIPGMTEAAAKRAEELKEMIDNTVKNVRKLASELRPSMLDDMGLGAAVEWLLSEFSKRSGVKTQLNKPEKEWTLPDSVKTGLYRIVQESLTNVGRYARAKNVIVNMLQKENMFVLAIMDDGIGFDKEAVAAKKTLGILGMKERTSIMEGTYEISSTPGKGTVVTVKVPLKK